MHYTSDTWGVHLWQFNDNQLFVRFVRRDGKFTEPLAARVLQVIKMWWFYFRIRETWRENVIIISQWPVFSKVRVQIPRESTVFQFFSSCFFEDDYVLLQTTIYFYHQRQSSLILIWSFLKEKQMERSRCIVRQYDRSSPTLARWQDGEKS